MSRATALGAPPGYPDGVTRIIAGAARGAALTVPRRGTRPTSERVREAMLSAIEARMELAGASVLDLYAGSGALGLEAASRGAGSVTLVERDPAAARALRGNARAVRERLAHEARIEVAAVPAERFLRERGGRFQLALLDPPYELGAAALGIALDLLTARLAPDALVVLERSARDPEPEWPEGLHLERSRYYGETAVYYAHPA